VADAPRPGGSEQRRDEPRPRIVEAQEGATTEVKVVRRHVGVDLDPRMILLADPDSPRAASFRVLRHRLSRSGQPRVVAVTSAGAGEGKTTCALNLALALAECGRARVLLVEANLRTPALAALFGVEPPVCFSRDVAQHKERPLDPWSVIEVLPTLHLAAIATATEPGPLLDGPAFAFAISALARGPYDHLVLDTPPVLGSADVNLIEDSVEGIVLCARAGLTTTRSLERCVDQLQPAKILGVTLVA
jgi:Mrp family chromosome partitioning ATPase